ncbi:MAG: malic enzyme-like NAD(P)-binding protein, partial [Aeromicrobium sp.]
MVATDIDMTLDSPDPNDPIFALHRGGKMQIAATVPLRDADDLSMSYTPGVARVCEAIAADPEVAHEYTWVSNTVAVVTDGSAVLGLGDIGPAASMPVMEGKAVLFKQFGGVDAIPIALNTQDVDEIVETIVRLAPSFGGINLEDISSPRCFEIERQLIERLDIPVFHDDQHGTAVVTLAALINAARLTDRDLSELKVVVSGAGAAGVAITKMLRSAGVMRIAVIDRTGVIHPDRTDLNSVKQWLAADTAPWAKPGSVEDALDCA